MIQVSKVAPEFSLQGIVGDQIKKFRPLPGKSKWTVLFFYPLDFTFVCPTEIKEFNRRLDEFEMHNAQVFGISTDSVYSHQAWIKNDLGELDFPLLSDITKEVSRQYGVLLEEKGVALRGTFVIDPHGILQYQVVHDLNVGRSVQETLRVLQALQTGAMCPIEWNDKKKTLGKAK